MVFASQPVFDRINSARKLTSTWLQLGRFSVLLILLFLGSGLVGCGPVISEQFRAKANEGISFRQILEKPSEYQGQHVILAGYILEIVQGGSGSEIVILQAPLDSSYRPKEQNLSQGRFIVLTKELLDPTTYQEGRRITIGGRVAGSRRQGVGNGSYEYPLIEAEEIRPLPRKAPKTPPFPYGRR